MVLRTVAALLSMITPAGYAVEVDGITIGKTPCDKGIQLLYAKYNQDCLAVHSGPTQCTNVNTDAAKEEVERFKKWDENVEACVPGFRLPNSFREAFEIKGGLLTHEGQCPFQHFYVESRAGSLACANGVVVLYEKFVNAKPDAIKVQLRKKYGKPSRVWKVGNEQLAKLTGSRRTEHTLFSSDKTQLLFSDIGVAGRYSVIYFTNELLHRVQQDDKIYQKDQNARAQREKNKEKMQKEVEGL